MMRQVLGERVRFDTVLPLMLRRTLTERSWVGQPERV